MKFVLSYTAVISLLTCAYAVPVGLKIPGILNLDIGHGNSGLHIDILGGLINANIGNGNKKNGPKTSSVDAPATNTVN
ncbi:hypothetical protein H4S06_001638 [Coemansia sp. BCRC 34490]|nr:hypothetical protein H4S06_001638 [Coemansia sp. BCRC 34490]